MMFLYRLALHMRIWNVEGEGGLADQMPAEQLYKWMAFFQFQPWGDEWLRDAVLMAQQYNANRPKGKPAMKPHDFMPVEKREQSQAEMLRLLRSVKR